MHDSHSELCLKNIEIAITMQQRMSAFKTESRDKTINGFSYRVSARPKPSVVLSSRYCQIASAGSKDVKSSKLLLYLEKSSVASNALQHFAQDQVSQSHSLTCELLVEP